MSTKKPKVKKETEYLYTNKFSGKEIRFSPSSEEVVATFEPRATDETVHEVMGAASMAVSQGVNMERGFAVFQVPPDVEAKSAADTLENQPHIINTLPVMTDEEGLTRYFLPDEFTVQFEKGVSKEDAKKIIKNKGCQILVEQRTPGYYTLVVTENKGLFETLREFSDMVEVAFAEPSEVGFDDALVYFPDDPEFSRLWGIHNTGQTVEGVAGTSDADIDAPYAWEFTRGNPNVIIAVIDTGADLDHPDLVANFLPRGGEDWDFADAGDDVPDDTGGHGTHVAGTAAAADNTAGVIGVAPRCRIMPLRINLSAGMNANRADAINYVATQATANPNRRYVINCSWKASGDHSAIRNAMQNALANNVVIVFAAGNTYHGAVTYPGRYPEPIAVGSTDNRDILSTFSAKGPEVDVCAPGTDIYSTYPDDGYQYLDGTSMASPHVAGLAALIWSYNPNLTNQQVRNIIETTCDNIDAKNPGHVGEIGSGRINAYRALLKTPSPPIRFRRLRDFPFPQKNSGSSSGLALARIRHIPHLPFPNNVLLFLTQRPYSERIYYLDTRTGAVRGTVDPERNDTIGCLEWDRRYIRVANVTTGAGSINTIDPRTGRQLGSVPVPTGRGEGLAYDGRYFYYSTINRIHVIHGTTGAVVRSFVPPGGPCRALAYGRGYLFSGNSTAGIITVFDARSRRVRGTISAPGGGSAKCDGLAFDPGRNELFIANQSKNQIYVGRVTL
jgi:subtilisin family serine protease